MKKGSLRDAFFNSSVSGFFFRHSEWLSSWPFTIGYAALVAKGGMNPDLDTVAGLLMMASGAGLALQKKWPSLSFRLSGALGACAALCLSAKGINFDTMEIVNGWRFVAPLTGPLIVNTLIAFQKEVAQFSQAHLNSDSGIKRAFARAGQYPLLASACIDLTNGPNFIMTAITEHDNVFLGAIGVFAVGDLGLIASDQRLQKTHRNYKEGNAPAPASP